MPFSLCSHRTFMLVLWQEPHPSRRSRICCCNSCFLRLNPHTLMLTTGSVHCQVPLSVESGVGSLLILNGQKSSSPMHWLQQCSAWELLNLSDQQDMYSASSVHVACSWGTYSCPATKASQFTLSKLQCSSEGSLHALGISTALSDNGRASCLPFHLCTDSHSPVSSREHREAILGKRHKNKII